MSKKPIKLDLFRFVTLTSHQIIDKKEAKTRHIIPGDSVTTNLGEGEIAVFTNQDEKEFTEKATVSVVIKKRVSPYNKVDLITHREALPTSKVQPLKNELTLTEMNSWLNNLINVVKALDIKERVYHVA